MTPEIRNLLKEARTIIRTHARWTAKDWDERATKALATPPQRTWVDLSDAQIGQVYFDVVQVHRGSPMPWGQVQFGRALLDKFKEVNT